MPFNLEGNTLDCFYDFYSKIIYSFDFIVWRINYRLLKIIK